MGSFAYIACDSNVQVLVYIVQVDLDLLRELAWSGTPGDLRPLCWQLLLGYLPPNRDRRSATLDPRQATHEHR